LAARWECIQSWTTASPRAAFVGDITDLKQMLPEYKRIEREVETAIFRRFDSIASAD
jgi:hypothetical protein